MVTPVPFTDEVRRFILTSISSVPYLEAMLLVRSHSAESWDAKALAQRLYMSEKAAGDLLSELHNAGVVGAEAAEASYRYDPQSQDLRGKIDALAHVYASHLVEVANLIHSKAGKSAFQFADAFKWRKDE